MIQNSKVKGFTLVEVLIVIFIVGLLSSVVLVGLGSFRARGRDARRIADLHQIQNGLELYINKEGVYPNVTANNSGSWRLFTETLKNAGIGVAAVPNDPAATATNDKSYSYGISSDGLSYVIGGRLEDANDAVLKNDLDGTIFEIDCADPAYCIQL